MAQDALDGPFRHRYLTHEALTRQLEEWAQAFPQLARLQSIGTTPQGRDIWVLTIGPEPERRRPGVWVDGNMHGTELAGSSVALAVAEAALALHLDPEALPGGWPEHQRRFLREVLFYVCPRISPDGAEQVLRQRGFVRSAPRRTPDSPARPHWRTEDLDGDGQCRYLRRHDEAGDFVESPDHPGLMLPRRVEDPPPYWRLYPEGVIAHWDGVTIPEPDWLRDTPDFNRHFPWGWRPEPDQLGAGHYPGDEPEPRAVIDFALAHPNLYAWLNLHTFGGVFIRPLADAPDDRMDQHDLALYRQLAAWGQSLVGYPTVSGFEEFTYEPDTPLHGDLTDFAYHQRGCVAQVCELWDLFHRLGRPRPERFIDHYTAFDREEMERLAQWDLVNNHGRLFHPWHPLDHPQLGAVEVGGLDACIGIWNPPPEILPAICNGLVTYWLQVASLLPRLVIEAVRCTSLGDGYHELTVTVANHGYLPSYGVQAARERPWNSGVEATASAVGCRLHDPGQARQVLGHLEGWGRGLGDTAQMPWFQRSRGNGHQARVCWVILGEGEVTVRIGSPRLGEVHQTIPLPGESGAPGAC
ncbi:M14 family metallopeptidase [Halomonas sp. LBP4]|uniref:M14 family metallopeptidase n=1 Tax=Halomonas sp. LBP4 TaxID=2044917 RepID=UPI000D76A7E0|nr:M14 family metallopeptidase [Halomonas sp. LBP4]PXX99717.1 peptidase M14 [Halomonas sp. LBP4]